ncbi:MAG: HD family phosphohydrolase, partial [Bacteroidota bacterium]
MNIKILLFVLTILVCGMFFVLRIDYVEDRAKEKNIVVGQEYKGQTIEARFSFPVYKSEEEYQAEMDKAAERARPVFIFKQEVIDQSLRRLNSLIDKLTELAADINEKTSGYFSEKVTKPFSELSINQRRRESKTIAQTLRQELIEAYRNGFVNYEKEMIKHHEIILQLPPNSQKILKATSLVDAKSFLDEVKNELLSRVSQNSMPIGLEIITKVMNPNYIYSGELTEQNIELARRSVPRTIGIVHEGETIVSSGEIISAKQLRKLKSYYNSMNLRSEDILSWKVITGKIGHAGLIIVLMVLYLLFIRKKIFSDNVEVAIICSMFIAVSFLSWLSVVIPSTFPLEYLIFLPAFSMLIAIVFDSRTAFYATVTMSLLVAGIRGNDYITGLVMMFTGTLAAYTVRDIQSRTQMYQSIFFVFIGFMISVFVISFEQAVDFMVIVKRLSLSLVNAAISPVATFGFLWVIEHISDVATDLRIKEYDNLNHPLLQKMSEISPGTYQHTLAVAMLAEKCANAIDANPILAKVGTYFHDIGKIARPEYFAENQMEKTSKHDLLPPRKSANAIKEHVVEGIELAKQYKLPRRLIDFIPMHHGTTLIRHFYAKALEESQTGKVDEKDFRYPGPRPNNKETAILMICDSAEALSRVIGSNDEKLEQAIEKNIRERLDDRQFDDSPISMKELQIIKETCLKNLHGMSHQRVKYKEIPTGKEEGGEK